MTLPALSPPIGGQSISVAALMPADVIVSTTNAAISRAIRTVSSSVVSHAMIYAGGGFVIESIGTASSEDRFLPLSAKRHSPSHIGIAR